MLLHRGADPSDGISREAEAALGIEPVDGAHHADIAFGDELAQGHAIAAIAGGDLDDEPEMAGDRVASS
jgi:hypothetical protein